MLKPIQIDSEFIPNPNILITAGIGDFLALDSFFPFKFKSNLKKICYATRAFKQIIELINSFDEYKGVEHINLYESAPNAPIPISVSKYDVEKKLIQRRIWRNYSDILLNCADFSVAHMFTKCKVLETSSIITNKVADIKNKYPLPESFFILCPYSVHMVPGRDFNNADWDFVINILIKKHKLKFVVLGVGNYKIPFSTNILNLMNRTSYCDAIEVMKKAQGYVGIDSSFSVLAPKLFPKGKIMIKLSSDWTYKFRYAYYAPFLNPSFLDRDLHIAYERSDIKYSNKLF